MHRLRRADGVDRRGPGDDVVVDVEILETSVGPAGAHRRGDRLTLLEVGVRYGNRQVVRDVSLRVAPGEVVVLIGHNGCGKSSTLRAVFGLTPPCGGAVVIDDVDVTDGTAAARRALGVAFVPASGEVFDDLTVQHNLTLAAGPRATRELVARRTAEVLAVFGGLTRSLHRPAGALSGGEQRMVGLGMALMTRPRLLLLDEPSKHLAPAAAAALLAVVAGQARRHGTAVLIAEVNVAAALQVADRVYVMRSGEVTAEHTGAELAAAGPTAWWTMF